MKVVIDHDAYLPERAHSTDAGLDLRSREEKIVPPHGSAVFRTGVHVQLPEGTAGVLISKSGLNVRFDSTSTGLIDEGYTGEICVKLYNHGDRGYKIERGDKISQLVVIPVKYVTVERAESLDESERGDNGFGSTGR